jgi:hypothetical protein
MANLDDFSRFEHRINTNNKKLLADSFKIFTDDALNEPD